jgi:hypothetical protein
MKGIELLYILTLRLKAAIFREVSAPRPAALSLNISLGDYKIVRSEIL